MAMRTSCSVGSGLSRRNSMSVVRMPGVQKPHWSPWCSWKACCRGCSLSAEGAMPSTVRISWPSACTANAVLAAEMGAGEAELVPDEISQRHADLDFFFVPLAVDGQRDFPLLSHCHS